MTLTRTNLEDIAREYLIDLLLRENRHTESNIFCNYDRTDNEAYCTVEAEKLQNDYSVSQVIDEKDTVKKDGIEYAVHIVKIVLADKVIVDVVVYPKVVNKNV